MAERPVVPLPVVWARGTVMVACGGEYTLNLSLRNGLVDHETTVILHACGDAVLTGATRANANALVVIAVR
jgi:glycerate-2-kinase